MSSLERRARRAREHAAAFGDSLDRDVQAEFGAVPKVATSAVASALKAAPRLTTAPLSLAPVKPLALAPSLTPQPKPAAVKPAPVPAPAPVKPAPVAVSLKSGGGQVSPPSAKAKADAAAMFDAGAAAKAAGTLPQQNVIKAPAPKPASSAGTTAPGGRVLTAAQAGNFLDASSTPLAAPNVSAPKETAAQQAAREKAVAAAKAAQLKLDAQKQAQANVQYNAERAKVAAEEAAYVKRMQTEDTPEARAWRERQKRISSAGVDWGLIPAGAAVLATGAAIIATGGAVAGAIAAPSAAGVLGAAVAADRALAAAEKAKLVKPGASGAVGAVLDVAAAGQTVIDATNKLASEGVPAAIEGAKVLAETAAQRAASGALPGVPQALTGEGARAYAEYLDMVPPALRGALDVATPKPPSGSFSGAIVSTNRVDVTTAPRASVLWFVSAAGKVSRGAGSGRGGFNVYSDGKVVKT